MSDKQIVQRLERGRRIASAPQVNPDPLAARAFEDNQLAREAIRAFTDDLATYRRVKAREPNRTNPGFLEDALHHAFLRQDKSESHAP